MSRVFKIFEEFKNGEYVHLEDLKFMNDHICGNLNNWISNYRFWYNMYSYSSKAYIVCQWRQSKGLPLIAEWGEAVCGKDLVDFLKILSIKIVAVGVCIINSFFYYFL